MTAGPGTSSRLERRKAQTRGKLIAAARSMLAEGTAQQASIQEITDAADVGFGSFYNHFATKAELFEAAVTDVLEETGALLDGLGTDTEDPAVTFARSVRLAARLIRARPEVARILVAHGMPYMDSPEGLGPRALRDIMAGVEAGRFQVTNMKLALATIAGSLLGTLHLALTDPAFDNDDACDQLAEQLLRMLGLTAAEAQELATTPLPVISGTSQRDPAVAAGLHREAARPQPPR
ncbi:TetR/AcrR family transcriptional regulator [Pseudonocardia sp. DSM 110487]|uniref:TetR/AcrR family transcriptional regulator n=1 Tax=Pseudonocardia sp. DSM 110487 TaxID=2865833 RepID=UPI001C6A3C9B|nr:TetR/AcrR family transcriptional regulator [Pseudonocardia sp. DSM 110487]QYN36952.1 TetR/AcrR family transcriptional regulator [Pseudonocardia sp. DSM 110487]